MYFQGDLHEFLIANSPNEGKSLTQHQFLHIAMQIAQGNKVDQNVVNWIKRKKFILL